MVSVPGSHSYDVETVEVSTDIFVQCMKLYISMTDPDVFARQDMTNHWHRPILRTSWTSDRALKAEIDEPRGLETFRVVTIVEVTSDLTGEISSGSLEQLKTLVSSWATLSLFRW